MYFIIVLLFLLHKLNLTNYVWGLLLSPLEPNIVIDKDNMPRTALPPQA